MKTSAHVKRIIIECICLLYSLLFIYASVSKLLDFERFQVQLSQSPILSAFAGWISWAVIGIELFIAVLLMFSKTRTVALFGALSLMIMFTAYIFIILHYSSFVPCSCGGILEKMTWDVHLIFNLVFVVLAIIALILHTGIYQKGTVKRKKQLYIGLIIFWVVASIMLIVGMFLSSEEIIHHKNPFIRQYPKKVITEVRTFNLKFNSYYFAGQVNDILYLGNYTDPLHLMAIDKLGHKKIIKLDLINHHFSFRSVKIVIRGTYIYLMDGTVPCVFRGKIKDWKINTQLKGVPRFTTAEPMDSISVVFRNNTGKDRANVLGFFCQSELPPVRYTPDLLQRQIDGIFDTDGTLRYNEEMKLMIYNYFYRNEFIAADTKGNLQFRGHTIDTITRAKIKVAYLKGNTERQMGAPPFMVNALSATRNHLLFVHSKVPGRYENDKVWKHASIIDVYNLKGSSYLLSFPLYTRGDQKIQDLFLTSNDLFVMAGEDLIVYKLDGLLKKEMQITVGNVPKV